MKPGDPVIILRSMHPDIRQGATGTFDGFMPGGYAVQVEANYYQVSGGTKRETRTVFVAKGDLEDNNQ